MSKVFFLLLYVFAISCAVSEGSLRDSQTAIQPIISAGVFTEGGWYDVPSHNARLDAIKTTYSYFDAVSAGSKLQTRLRFKKDFASFANRPFDSLMVVLGGNNLGQKGRIVLWQESLPDHESPFSFFYESAGTPRKGYISTLANNIVIPSNHYSNDVDVAGALRRVGYNSSQIAFVLFENTEVAEGSPERWISLFRLIPDWDPFVESWEDLDTDSSCGQLFRFPDGSTVRRFYTEPSFTDTRGNGSINNRNYALHFDEGHYLKSKISYNLLVRSDAQWTPRASLPPTRIQVAEVPTAITMQTNLPGKVTISALVLHSVRSEMHVTTWERVLGESLELSSRQYNFTFDDNFLKVPPPANDMASDWRDIVEIVAHIGAENIIVGEFTVGGEHGGHGGGKQGVSLPL